MTSLELVNCCSYSVIRTRIEKNLLEKYNSGQVVSDDYASLLMEFVPFGSFLLCLFDKTYGAEEANDTISILIVQEVVQNSFKDDSKSEVQKW